MNDKVHERIENGKKIIKKLFLYYLKHPEELPGQNGEKPEIMVKDYIAGMTDHFAEERFRQFNLS